MREAIAAQIEAQPALQEMVAGFEQRYDRMITSGAGSVVPSAEDISAEVEEYLASFEAEGGQAPEGSAGMGRARGQPHL